MTTELVLKNAPDFSTPQNTAKTLQEATEAIKALKEVVKENLTTYTPDNFKTIAEAKNARAELNASATRINDLRKSYEKQYLEAFNEFKSLCNETCNLISDGASALDKVVKDFENKEKELKKSQIESYWKSTNFDLFNLEKVFNAKWLNKSVKFEDVTKEIDEIQKKTFADLKTLEAFNDLTGTAKAFYLETLDIGSAINKTKEIQEAKERAEKEAQARAEREHNEQIQAQKRQEFAEVQEQKKEEQFSSMVADALEQKVDADRVEQWTLQFKARRSVLIKLKQYMTQNGIEYVKL